MRNFTDEILIKCNASPEKYRVKIEKRALRTIRATPLSIFHWLAHPTPEIFIILNLIKRV